MKGPEGLSAWNVRPEQGTRLSSGRIPAPPEVQEQQESARARTRGESEKMQERPEDCID
jgi:hypothetical protein